MGLGRLYCLSLVLKGLGVTSSGVRKYTDIQKVAKLFPSQGKGESIAGSASLTNYSEKNIGAHKTSLNQQKPN